MTDNNAHARSVLDETCYAVLATADADGNPWATPVWFALQLGPSTFGIFDAFPNKEGRQAHLEGPIAKAVMDAADLLAKPLSLEPFDVIGGKIAVEVIGQAVPKAA